MHVAGTNGKGSTCAFLDAILRADGLKVGLFTSPYLERFEERIRVDGEDISPEALRDATLAVRDAAEEVEAALGEHPTEFELMFAVACVRFARAGCDVAVVEVGLGGRLDATNVVAPDLAVITRIGLDHTDVLGSTLAEIAFEKAGIVKPGVPVVSYPQEPAAMEVIEGRCASSACPLVVTDFSRLVIESLDVEAGVRRFSYCGRSYETRLLALYQPENAAVAIDAACALGVDSSSVQEGIARAAWPGRFEVLGRRPLVIVDGSHNPQGALSLTVALEELLGGVALGDRDEDSITHKIAPQTRSQCPEEGHGAVTFVMGVLADKDYPRMIEAVLPLARRFFVYAPCNPRALSAELLADEIRRQDPRMDVRVADRAATALEAALESEGPEGVVAAFGTLYSIGAVKRAYASLGASSP